MTAAARRRRAVIPCATEAECALRSDPVADTALDVAWNDLRALVEQVEDYAIFVLDLTGRVASWNRGAQKIKGYAASEIIGQHFSKFYPEEDKASRKPERELEQALATGHIEDEGWRIRADGSRFWAFVSISRNRLIWIRSLERALTWTVGVFLVLRLTRLDTILDVRAASA